MCVQVHTFVWMGMLTCVSAYENQRTISDIITQAPPILFVVVLRFWVFVCLFICFQVSHSPEIHQENQDDWKMSPLYLTDTESSGMGL